MLVLGCVLVWLGITPFEPDVFEECGGSIPEGSTFTIRASAWPPGTRECVVSDPAGATRRHVFVPWRELMAAGLLGVAAGQQRVGKLA